MLCVITGVLRTPNGTVHSSATVKFRRAAPVHGYVAVEGPAVVVPDEVTVTSDVDGEMTVSLYPGRYQVELLGSNESKYNFSVAVPLEETLSFVELLVQAPEYPFSTLLESTVAGYAANAYDSMVAAGLSEVAAGSIAAGLNPAAVVITGGTINGTVIGGTTPAAGAFTTLSASSTVTLAGTAITATGAELNKLAGTPAGLTSTELGYLDGATGPIQPQLDAKAPLASPSLIGVPVAPTATPGTSTTQLATTEFVTTADNLKATLANPTLTGVPAAPTAAPGTNTTQLATTAFVAAAAALKANLANPALTGVPTAPTAAVDTNTTQIATTEFVQTEIAALAGITLLGTLTPTSGSLHTLSGLDLTPYKFLRVVLAGVSVSGVTDIILAGETLVPASAASASWRGIVDIDLTDGTFTSNLADAVANDSQPSVTRAGDLPVTTATTSITFEENGGGTNFDGSGSVRFYGVR